MQRANLKLSDFKVKCGESKGAPIALAVENSHRDFGVIEEKDRRSLPCLSQVASLVTWPPTRNAVLAEGEGAPIA
jgi:hypothetical protein